MNELNVGSHVSQSWLYGPAERTLIEPWLTGHAGLMTNAYPDPPLPDVTIPDTIASLPPLHHPALAA